MSGNKYTTLARACQSSRATTRGKHWQLGVALNLIESRSQLSIVISQVCKDLGGNREATRKMMQRAMLIAKTCKTLEGAMKEPKAKAKKPGIKPLKTDRSMKVAMGFASLNKRERAYVLRTSKVFDKTPKSGK
jgi:hypothetical protein